MHPEITLHGPPGAAKLTRPTPSNPRPKDNPPLLTDALTVRNTVFIDEQGCSPESEIDEDDARSWHWVMYSSSRPGGEEDGGQGRKQDCEKEGVGKDEAVGVIRLVPPPHAPHEHHDISPAHAHTHTHTDNLNPVNDQVNDNIHSPVNQYDTIHEPYIKLTRVAVLPAYRGRNLGRKLVETAIDWARRNPGEIEHAYSRVVRGPEGLPDRDGGSGDVKWNGLVLVHAQVSVEGMYARLGFVTDEGMGRWHEEGIEHVGMWRRVDVVHES
ncbi:GNAT family N-acetyltransferase [Aspergillus ruber CBS 135680]|uniref:Glucosamine 6-phosphate N-acetyltransferase n=1 Tax=Aspergillus ruber (strain CBS 135680) TaxID=1388766 RepID=A0A017SR83_ASPRC|nr:uncharacterized protein EURHEDRAFT_408008 [Aspergillus ruber CBS 135680]EYE98800.1 hypothetical protein EURHEDRAFT_408008 [Aspergillus ruber CBS 135680]